MITTAEYLADLATLYAKWPFISDREYSRAEKEFSQKWEAPSPKAKVKMKMKKTPGAPARIETAEQFLRRMANSAGKDPVAKAIMEGMEKEINKRAAALVEKAKASPAKMKEAVLEAMEASPPKKRKKEVKAA
jgi:hypothetical protein